MKEQNDTLVQPSRHDKEEGPKLMPWTSTKAGICVFLSSTWIIFTDSREWQGNTPV